MKPTPTIHHGDGAKGCRCAVADGLEWRHEADCPSAEALREVRQHWAAAERKLAQVREAQRREQYGRARALQRAADSFVSRALRLAHRHGLTFAP
jgi:hypothetical protein